jgi:NAD(P)-dependent dehydrogenase (short-subunit alcohol dehydrogenase family)
MRLLVTGAGSGIGAALVSLAMEDGATVACLARDAAEAARLGVAVDRAGDEVAIETVFCLGNCALGPAALVDGALVGHLDAARLRALVAGCAAEAVQGLPS